MRRPLSDAPLKWRAPSCRQARSWPPHQAHQALLHAESMGTVEWGAILPSTACT